MSEPDRTVHLALPAWYAEEYPKVYRALLVLTGSPSEARDLTDEAFTRAVERWRRVSRMDSPGGWVQTVALNLFRRSRRHHSDRPLVESDLVAVGLDEHVDVDLQRAIAMLSTRKRQAVVCRYVLDMTERETAAALGVAVGTVARILHEARNELRAQLAIAQPTVEAPK